MNTPKLKSSSHGNKDKTVILRLDEFELHLLREKAKEYTGGNVSDLLRQAIVRWNPELTEEEKQYADFTRRNTKVS